MTLPLFGMPLSLLAVGEADSVVHYTPIAEKYWRRRAALCGALPTFRWSTRARWSGIKTCDACHARAARGPFQVTWGKA